ncbi:MAG TPA: hypothetical protein PK794_10570, partial [Armatimonadota bacterium]|nr:hypothetical protein [Armatimonadota bacterium]
MFTLENSDLRLTLSARGTLDELTCRATGTNHIARPGMELWRIILQDEESLVNLVAPGNQPCAAARAG